MAYGHICNGGHGCAGSDCACPCHYEETEMTYDEQERDECAEEEYRRMEQPVSACICGDPECELWYDDGPPAGVVEAARLALLLPEEFPA